MSNVTDRNTSISVILAPVLAVETVIGLVGNGIALGIFCSYRNRWSSSTVYLFNLVIADFFLIINLPFRTHYYLKNEFWIFTEIFCSVNLFMFSMNRTASIIFLTAIATDRYFKVVHPYHQMSKISTPCAAKVAIGLWITVILMNSHVFMLDHNYSHHKCQSFSPRLQQPAAKWHALLFFLEFFLPLGIIIFCIFNIISKLKQRKLDKNNKVQKSVKILVVIVLLYTLCFLPSILIAASGLVVLIVSNTTTNVETIGQLLHVSLAFTYLNSALDPVLYCFSSAVFLQRCKNMLCQMDWFKTSVIEGTNENPKGYSGQQMKNFQPSSASDTKEIIYQEDLEKDI